MIIYKCPHCGRIVMNINSSNEKFFCCQHEMTELIANTTDASAEKHVPTMSIDNGLVHIKVGSVAHPMQDIHYIEWIALETKDGNIQLKYLKPNDAPEAKFSLINGEQLYKVYAYCNLHGLWVAAY